MYAAVKGWRERVNIEFQLVIPVGLRTGAVGRLLIEIKFVFGFIFFSLAFSFLNLFTCCSLVNSSHGFADLAIKVLLLVNLYINNINSINICQYYTMVLLKKYDSIYVWILLTHLKKTLQSCTELKI